MKLTKMTERELALMPTDKNQVLEIVKEICVSNNLEIPQIIFCSSPRDFAKYNVAVCDYRGLTPLMRLLWTIASFEEMKESCYAVAYTMDPNLKLFSTHQFITRIFCYEDLMSVISEKRRGLLGLLPRLMLAAPAIVQDKNTLYVIDAPEKIYVEDGFLSHESEPAVQYADGHGFHAIDGYYFSKTELNINGSLLMARIDEENNLEKRRILIERMGWRQYLQQSEAKLVDEEDQGDWYEYLLKIGDHSITVLMVNDPSTGRCYILSVPVSNSTCANAQHWLTGFDSFYKDLGLEYRNKSYPVLRT